MGRYLKMAKQAGALSADQTPEQTLGSCDLCGGVEVADVYWRNADDAIRRIGNECPELPKVMQWLRQANPRLYRNLSDLLPTQIGKMWGSRTPLIRFRAVLDRWVTAHNDARLFYESQAGRPVASEGERVGATEHKHSSECLHRARNLR